MLVSLALVRLAGWHVGPWCVVCEGPIWTAESAALVGQVGRPAEVEFVHVAVCSDVLRADARAHGCELEVGRESIEDYQDRLRNGAGPAKPG